MTSQRWLVLVQLDDVRAFDDHAGSCSILSNRVLLPTQARSSVFICRNFQDPISALGSISTWAAAASPHGQFLPRVCWILGRSQVEGLLLVGGTVSRCTGCAPRAVPPGFGCLLPTSLSCARADGVPPRRAGARERGVAMLLRLE
jgi:hypothetical protein